MSYLENGSTLRSMFRMMSPLRHDIDPTRSEVLAHIRQNLGCDLGRSIRAFNSMRHKKSQVIIYDMVHRQWRGCDWAPVDEGDKDELFVRTVNELKREVFALKSLVKKHERRIGQLERKRPSKREDEVDDEAKATEPEIKPVVDYAMMEEAARASAAKQEADAKESEEWFRAMRAALDDADRVSSPSVPPQ